MDRCFKVVAVVCMFTCILFSANTVNAMELYNQVQGIKVSDDIIKNDKNEKPEIEVTSKLRQQKRQIINIDNKELELLSRLVSGEARGETYEGQVAVAAVVINRVLDDRFPDTIESVIYQKNAFSVVNDGSINMKPTESASRAVEEALYGVDPTNESVYFWNPEISTCNWIKKLNPHMRIGNHVFAK